MKEVRAVLVFTWPKSLLLPGPPYDFFSLPHSLHQQSPTFVAPDTSFVEDNFSTDTAVGDGFGRIQAHCIQAYLLLCGPVPNRPQTSWLGVGDPCSIHIAMPLVRAIWVTSWTPGFRTARLLAVRIRGLDL